MGGEWAREDAMGESVFHLSAYEGFQDCVSLLVSSALSELDGGRGGGGGGEGSGSRGVVGGGVGDSWAWTREREGGGIGAKELSEVKNRVRVQRLRQLMCSQSPSTGRTVCHEQ